MSTSPRNLKVIQSAPSSLDTSKGPGGIPLYYKNVGLFSDPFLDELNAARVTDPFLLRACETEGLSEFSACYEWMLQYWEKYRDLIPKWSEAELEDKWVRPLLQQLGWTYQAQVRVAQHGKREIPDYALFDSEKSYTKAQKPYAAENYDAFFSHVLAVADAKRYGVCLDGSKTDNTNPSYQIFWYQKITGKRWGILTDGVYWRLYSAEAKNKFSSYYEVNISKFLEERDDEAFKHFFNFFRKDAFAIDEASKQSFLDVVFANGERYAAEVEKKLKDRAFHLVEMICQGFLESKRSPSEDDLKEVYQHSLYYLFRLLFIVNSEAKGLLNVGNQSDYYPYSIRKLCEDLKGESERNQKWASASLSYNRIRELFELIRKGDERIGIHGLGEEVFASGDAKFFKENSISDSHLNQVLLELSCQKGKDSRWRFIDYKRLSADHIGSIFEGLLEFSLKKEGGTFCLVNFDGERKATGAYYTPDYIVDDVVGRTLGPLIEGKTASEILKLKCADIAMGSGHFLLGMIRFLEEAVLERLEVERKSSIVPSEVRWQILHNCVYGFDINPLAAELAKFSLWMYSARAGFELEPLKDQIFCGDSLTSDQMWKECARELKTGSSPKFSAIVGNPPYIRIQASSSSSDYHRTLQARYKSASFGSYDLYALFIEKGMDLLAEDGRLGFILPHKFFLADYGRPLRELLAEKQLVSEIVHFGDLQIFKEATTYTCILALTRTSNKKFEFTQIRDIESFTNKTAKSRVISSTELNSDVWNFGSKEDKALLGKLESSPMKLSEISEKIFQGAITGVDSIYVLKVLGSSGKYYRVASKELPDTELLLEKAICRKILRGSDISKYDAPEAGSVVIFPYRSAGQGRVEVMSSADLQEIAPNTYEYLLKFKSRLSARDKVSKNSWWAFSRPQNLTLFQQQKILSQVLSRSGKFAFDSRGEYFFLGGGTAGGNAIKLRKEFERFNKILLAILNSAVTNFYVASVGSAFRGGFRAFGKASLEHLPLPRMVDSTAMRELEKLVDARIERGTKATSPTETTSLESRIESAVFKLYGLTESEQAQIREVAQSQPEIPSSKKAA